jgi:putative transcriptional regulator
MTKQYRSRVLASVHETAEGLTGAGVMSKQTMREFDELGLTPVRPLTPGGNSRSAGAGGASQAVFARYLNVTTGLGQPVGTRGEAPARRITQVTGPRRQKRAERRRVGGASRDREGMIQ